MNAAVALRARMATSAVARRGFSTTRAQLGSPYHYPEGPRSNIPFNPLTRFFFLRYWAFMSRLSLSIGVGDICGLTFGLLIAVGFGTPFAIAGMPLSFLRNIVSESDCLTNILFQSGKPTSPVKHPSLMLYSFRHGILGNWENERTPSRTIGLSCTKLENYIPFCSQNWPYN